MIDLDLLFRYLKGRCHGNQFCEKNGKLPTFVALAFRNRMEYRFLNVRINSVNDTSGSRCISMPNIIKICRSVVKIRFFDFSRWRRLPSWIFKFVKFYWQRVSGGPRLIILLSVIKMGFSVVEILQFFEFLRWPPPPSSIFQIRKFY